MTQDVQPLTWQKRTNLEEHQQFFSKINEIIDNLAPTVDEAEAAIAALQTADGQNVKINAINQYAVGLTGNQDYNGIKRAIQKIVKKVNFAGTELPTNYWIDNRLIEVAGNDDVPIISIGAERGNTTWSTRINLSIWGESNPDTGRISNARIIFIFDESNRNIRMQVGYTDNQGSPTLYNQQQTLFSW